MKDRMMPDEAVTELNKLPRPDNSMFRDMDRVIEITDAVLLHQGYPDLVDARKNAFKRIGKGFSPAKINQNKH